MSKIEQKFFSFLSFIAFLILLSATTIMAQRPIGMADFYEMKSARAPKISPDGKSVLFVVNQMDSTSNRNRNQIWITSLEGGMQEQLTFSGTSNHSPAWSPDGKFMAYVSNATGNSQIWVMNIQTKQAHQLTDLPEGAWQPVWQPNGKKIAFLSETKFKGRNPQELYDIKIYSHLRYRWWYDDNRYDAGWRSHIFVSIVEPLFIETTV